MMCKKSGVTVSRSQGHALLMVCKIWVVLVDFPTTPPHTHIRTTSHTYTPHPTHTPDPLSRSRIPQPATKNQSETTLKK
eukprot:m.44509 g.44509  ORF g.44509 m.44509 type:complete len:79 (+) comp19692_c0_seq2:50-286(+)